MDHEAITELNNTGLQCSHAGVTRASARPRRMYWGASWKHGMEDTFSTFPDRVCSTRVWVFLCSSDKAASRTDRVAHTWPIAAKGWGDREGWWERGLWNNYRRGRRRIQEKKEWERQNLLEACIVFASAGACGSEMRKRKLTDYFGRCQWSFLHGEVASCDQLQQWGQEQERKDADHIHDAHR